MTDVGFVAIACGLIIGLGAIGACTHPRTSEHRHGELLNPGVKRLLWRCFITGTGTLFRLARQVGALLSSAFG